MAQLSTLFCRRDSHSINPGVHVGIHLILWVLAVFVVSFHCLQVSVGLGSYVVWEHCHEDRRLYCNTYYFPSDDAAEWWFGMMEALAALSVMLLILHFALFVMACIEMDLRRDHVKKRKIMYLVAAPGMADGRMYYTPLDQPPQRDRQSVLAPQPSYHYHNGSSI